MIDVDLMLPSFTVNVADPVRTVALDAFDVVGFTVHVFRRDTEEVVEPFSDGTVCESCMIGRMMSIAFAMVDEARTTKMIGVNVVSAGADTHCVQCRRPLSEVRFLQYAHTSGPSVAFRGTVHDLPPTVRLLSPHHDAELGANDSGFTRALQAGRRPGTKVNG